MVVFYTSHVESGHFILTQDEAKHCVKSLRNSIGDVIHAFDILGTRYEGIITKITKLEVHARVLKTVEYSSNLPEVTIAMAPTKSPDRIEYALAKCIEIGLTSFCLIHTERTERTRYKLDRLQRIALSAAKQSLNFKLPTIETFDTLTLFHKHDQANHKMIAHCLDPKDHILQTDFSPNQSYTLLIGPEGDFTSSEIDASNDAGYKPVNLGPTRLRTETAAIAGLALIQGSAFAKASSPQSN